MRFGMAHVSIESGTRSFGPNPVVHLNGLSERRDRRLGGRLGLERPLAEERAGQNEEENSAHGAPGVEDALLASHRQPA